MDKLINRSVTEFRRVFGGPPEVVGVAPGRLEILGNHTDYNGGYILSVAIDRATAAAARACPLPQAAVWSEIAGEKATFNVRTPERVEDYPWANYVKGVVVELRKAGVEVPGFDAAIASSVPVGAGLSSSAALEVATAMAIRGLCPYKIKPMELAKLCRRAENEFAGMGCGILDQFSAIFGEADSFLFLDCMTLSSKTVKVASPGIALVVCDSKAKHELLEGKYDTRRSECVSAAKKLGEALGRKIRFLREVTLEEFEAHGNALKPNEWKRVNHVLRENARVLEGLEAVKQGNLTTLGRLMLESHASSRDHFENSCPELDALIEVAREAPGFLGGKLSGGGFGGATVNLVERTQTDAFQARVKRGFSERFGVMPETVVCGIGAGAQLVKIKPKP